MSKVKELYANEAFKLIIPAFMRSGTVQLNAAETKLLQEAYIELGGHAFALTCSGKCIQEILARFIKHTKKEADELMALAQQRKNTITPKNEGTKIAELRKKAEDERIQKLIDSGKAGVLEDGTIVDRTYFPDAKPYKQSKKKAGETGKDDTKENEGDNTNGAGETGQGDNPPAEDNRPNKELRDILTKAGVEFKNNTSRKVLLELVHGLEANK